VNSRENKEPVVAVIVPFLNEEENLPALFRQLTVFWRKLEDRYHLRVVFVDDGSSDGSWAQVSNLAAEDDRVTGVRLTRNFGSHSAIRAGMAVVKADFYAYLAADLQDPPEVIGRMLDKADEGYEVVWGERASRADPWHKSLLASVFWKLTRRMAGPDYPEGGADVFLFRRRVVERLLSFREQTSMFYYLVGWSGFKAASVPYDREARQSGVTKWSFRRRFSQAIGTFVAYSHLPLRFITLLGLLLFVLGVIGGLTVVLNFFLGHPSSGWTSIMTALLLLSGLQAIMLGIVSEYLLRIYEQIRRRPDFIIDTVIGGQAENTAPSLDRLTVR